MKKVVLFLLVSILMLMISCNKSTQHSDGPYEGENMYYGSINFTFPDSVGYNDTFSIITTVPNQTYRMKGHISLYVSGMKDSVIVLLSPSAVKGKNSYDTSDMKDSYSRINVDFYPNQGFSQEWKFVLDSTLVFNMQRNEAIQFYAFLKIDSIYLDMDSLFFPDTIADDLKPVAVPEKKWYDSDFSHFSSEQAQNDNRILLRYFNRQNWESSLFRYIYYKNQ